MMRRSLLIFLLFGLLVMAVAAEPAAVIATFHTKGGTITPVSFTVVPGGCPNSFLESGEFVVTTRSTTGAFQTEVWIEDPTLYRILDRVEGEPSYLVRDDVDFTVILPYQKDTAKVAVYDTNKTLLVEADLSPAHQTFCAQHPQYELCATASANLSLTPGSGPDPVLEGGVLVLAILGGWGLIHRRRRT